MNEVIPIPLPTKEQEVLFPLCMDSEEEKSSPSVRLMLEPLY